MKKVAYLLALSGALAFVSCGDSAETPTTDTTPTEATEAPVEVPKVVINEADWVEKDLMTVPSKLPVTVKVPSTATLSVNGNGQVEILYDPYTITVSFSMISSAKEGIDDLFSMTASSYDNIQAVVQEENGVVYSKKMKNEANGTTYETEYHFYYVLEDDGSFYTFKGDRTLGDAWNLPGSAFTEENAKKMYELVKSSAKYNK